MKINKIFLILLNCIYISFQIVQTRFFCGNFLREIYLIDEVKNSQKLILTEKVEKIWLDHYSYDNLDVDPGALIKL